MKLKVLLSLLLFFVSLPLLAKTENKYNESYSYTRGVEEFSGENYELALSWFERELSEHPDNGYAYSYIAAMRYNNDEYGAALSAVDKALKYIPKKDKEWRSISLDTRSNIHLALGDTVSAIDDLSLAIKTNPSDPDHYKSRGQLYFELKEYALSDADYQKLTTLDRGDVMGYMGLGRNDKSQEKWDDAIIQFDKAIRLSPDYSSGYSFRAEAYLGKKEWAKATDDIVKALEIDGDLKALYLMHDLPEEASALLKPKLKIRMQKAPADRFWPYYLGDLADSNEDYDEAIEYYEKSNDLDANPALLSRIAGCYMQLSLYDMALDYIERAISMNPEDDDYISQKATALSGLGRLDECIAERTRYVERNPEMPLAYLSRADDMMLAGHFQEAIDDYNTIVVLSPALEEFPYLLMKRGDAYRLTGKVNKARKDYEAILRIEKDSVMKSGLWTPFAHSGLGNAEKAIETMQAILANDTTDVKGEIYNLACIYARLGRKPEALRYLRESLENGYKEFAHLERDYDLDCLRDEPEYKALLEEFKPVDKEVKTADDDTTAYEIRRVEIPFTKEGGVTKVKCSINGLPLHFVFDTGASSVSLSQVEANFMLKNDFIKPSDIIGSARYVDANGNISEGTVVNIRSVNFGGLELDNVRASVVSNQKAPLLLGQSVLGRLGKIEIDNPGMKIVVTQKVKK